MAKLRGRITQRLAGTRGVLLSMSGYSAEALEGIVRGQQPDMLLLDRTHLEAMLSGLRSPADLPGDGHVGVVDLDKTSTVPIDDRLRSPHPHGHGVAVLLRSTPTASTARPPQPTSASPRPSAPGTPSKTSVTRATATWSRHPEMAGQSGNPGERGLHNRSCLPRPWPSPPPSVACPWPSVGRSVPVRGGFRLGSWTARTPKPGTHGRIADAASRKRASKRVRAGQRGG